MSVADNIAELTKKVADLYKELVTNSVRFEELRRQTNETISEFKHALERLSDKVDAIQQEHVKAQSALKAEVEVLRGRLDTLSEQALHAAVREVAREVVDGHVRQHGLGHGLGKELSKSELSGAVGTLPPSSGAT